MLKSAIPDVPSRLLLPVSSHFHHSISPPLPIKHGSTTRLGRPRSDSAAPSISTQSIEEHHRFFDFPSAFDLVQDHLQLSGYQIYAVEKWLVERTRANVLLAVYTGDPKDKITVSILAPSTSLSPEDARKEWEQAMHNLRRDGARPHETDKGVIMITSLANFRSDYTVVHIPDGNFPAHREQLYVNINLMRMGCSGRGALTLQEPSDTTKERFVTMYQFSETIRPSEEFRKTVLQLIKIIQSALSLFELFPIDPAEHNGLLCDQTVDGFQKWIVEAGDPYVSLEPTERTADPSAVAALLSLITAMRNKLSSLVPGVPKDPFLQSRRFVRALAQFVNQRINVYSKSPGPASAICHHAYFNLKLIKDIDRAFEKYRSSDAYRLHRVVFNKLDDFTSATTNAMTSSAKGLRHGKSLSLTMSSKDVEGLLECTTDLSVFVNKVISARAKDCAQSLRYLWSGRLEALERKRIENVWSDAEEEREKEREREKSESEDDGDLLGVRPWSNRVQKKLENWAGREFGRTRLKKQSPDQFTSPIIEKSLEEQVTPASTGSVPRVVVSGDQDEPVSGLSSGQASPISPSASMYALGNFPSAHGSALLASDDGLQRRLSYFNRSAVVDTHSSSAPPRRRTYSWSDPVSAEAVEIDQDGYLEPAHQRSTSGVSVGPALSSIGRVSPSPAVSRRSSYARGRRRQRVFLLRRKRSLSFDDRIFLEETDVLSPEHMQVDVDLCAQCWALSCRKFYITATIAILQALSQATSASNETLRRHNEEYAARVAQVLLGCELVADVEHALADADSARAETEALLYETNSLDVASLWRMARAPRTRVFTIRDRVFGVRSAGGRRRGALALAAAAASSGGVAGIDGLGHGRFNRVQKRLDGGARLVDYLGRTESEVEEEAELPEDLHMGEGDSESEDGEEEWRDALDTAGTGKDEDGRNQGTGQLQAFSGWLLELFTTWGRVLGVGRGREAVASDAGGGSVRGDDGETTEEEGAATVGGGKRPESAGLESESDVGLEVLRARGHGRGHGHGHGHEQEHTNGHVPRHRLSTVGEEDEDVSVSSVTSA